MGSDWTFTEYGSISSYFKLAPLGELCIPGDGVQTGPFGSQLHASDYVDYGTPIITVEHLGENRILHTNLPRVTEKDRERLSKYTLRTGDIVFSRVGSVDRRAIVHEEENGWLFSGRCLRVRPDSQIIDPDYLSWFFGLPSFQEHIRRIAVGATMPSLNTKLLSDVPIYYPPLPEQHAIAAVLGALDDKIELNRRMNGTLEATARALFRSWFVDFDPVRRRGDPLWSPSFSSAVEEGRHGGLPLPPDIAALFPGEMEDGRPLGWGVRGLGEILELAYGKALKEGNRRPGHIPVFGSNGQVGWHDEKLVDGPGIVVGRKGNPGIVTWSHTDFYPIDTTFYVVSKLEVPALHFLHYSLQNHDLASLSADSAVPGLNRNIAYGNMQIVPPINLITVFEDYSWAIFERIHALNEESRTLAALRDGLLPKLMRGEVRVDVAKQEAADAL